VWERREGEGAWVRLGCGGGEGGVGKGGVEDGGVGGGEVGIRLRCVSEG